MFVYGPTRMLFFDEHTNTERLIDDYGVTGWFVAACLLGL